MRLESKVRVFYSLWAPLGLSPYPWRQELEICTLFELPNPEALMWEVWEIIIFGFWNPHMNIAIENYLKIEIVNLKIVE